MNTSMPVERRGFQSRFALLLNAGASAETLKQLLQTNRKIACGAFWLVDGADTDLRWDVQLGPHHVDVAIGQYFATPNEWSWTLVDLLDPSAPLANDTSSGRTVASTREKFRQLRCWVGAHLTDAQLALPDLEAHFHASIIAGRRDRLTDADRKMLPAKWDSSDERMAKTYNGQVHTYDSLWEHGVE